MKNENTNKFLLIPIVLQLLWGFIPSASKMVLNEIPVELYSAVRWSISGSIFALYLIITKSWKPISKKSFFTVAALGIMGYAVGSFGTLYGLKIGGVVNYAFVSAVNPVVYSLVAIWLLREKPQRMFYIALPLAFLGLILLVLGKYQASSFSVAGLSTALILGAIILEAFVFIFSKRYKELMNLAQYLAISQLATAFFMWTLQLSYFQQTSQISNLTMKGLSALLFVAIGACVLYYVVFFWLLTFIDGHRLALLEGFHVVSGSIFGYFLFHEEVKPMVIVGGAMVVISLIIGNLPRTTPEKADT